MDREASKSAHARLALSADVASVACFLVSAASGFVTGEIVEVNGGFYFR